MKNFLDVLQIILQYLENADPYLNKIFSEYISLDPAMGGKS